MEGQLQGNGLKNYMKEGKCRMRKHHWLRHWTLSSTISKHRLLVGEFCGDQPGSLPDSLLFKTLVLFAVPSTDRLDQSSNHDLPRRIARQSLWTYPKLVPNHLNLLSFAVFYAWTLGPSALRCWDKLTPLTALCSFRRGALVSAFMELVFQTLSVQFVCLLYTIREWPYIP